MCGIVRGNPVVYKTVSRKSPSFHYGIAVIALLMFFITPVMLSRQNDKKGEEENSADDNKE